MTDARVFLSSQAHALCDGLRHSGDAARLAIAVAAHSAGHERWVDLLARAERDVLDELGALHALHSRLAESLERGLQGWLHAEAAHLVRSSQADRLLASTAAAVDSVGSSHLRRGERPWPAPTGSPTPSTKRSAATLPAARSATA